MEYIIYGNHPSDNSGLEDLLIEKDLRPESFGQPITDKETAQFHFEVLEKKGFKNLRIATFNWEAPVFGKNVLNI